MPSISQQVWVFKSQHPKLGITAIAEHFEMTEEDVTYHIERIRKKWRIRKFKRKSIDRVGTILQTCDLMRLASKVSGGNLTAAETNAVAALCPKFIEEIIRLRTAMDSKMRGEKRDTTWKPSLEVVDDTRGR